MSLRSYILIFGLALWLSPVAAQSAFQEISQCLNRFEEGHYEGIISKVSFTAEDFNAAGIKGLSFDTKWTPTSLLRGKSYVVVKDRESAKLVAVEPNQDSVNYLNRAGQLCVARVRHRDLLFYRELGATIEAVECTESQVDRLAFRAEPEVANQKVKSLSLAETVPLTAEEWARLFSTKIVSQVAEKYSEDQAKRQIEKSLKEIRSQAADKNVEIYVKQQLIDAKAAQLWPNELITIFSACELDAQIKRNVSGLTVRECEALLKLKREKEAAYRTVSQSELLVYEQLNGPQTIWAKAEADWRGRAKRLSDACLGIRNATIKKHAEQRIAYFNQVAEAIGSAPDNLASKRAGHSRGSSQKAGTASE